MYVVATPIGHLEDITLRALRILKTVRLVAAEDTRRTGNLLRHYEISTPVLSVHEHNEQARAQQLIARLLAGDSIALVTDAGTPGVSDPGASLVASVRAAGVRVEPVPGPSAVVAAISASGVQSKGFCFLGFAPFRLKDRKLWFATLLAEGKGRAIVFFEAPHRLLRTLAELDKLVERPIIVARELTKIHEEFVMGTPGELAARFARPQGEFTVIIPPLEETAVGDAKPSDVVIGDLFGQTTEDGHTGTRRDSARVVAERLGLTTREVYDALERIKIGQKTE